MSGPPLVIVLTSPSGTGKSTIIRDLLERDARLAFSVSHTTRRPRAEEREGIDYHFVSREHFEAIRAAGGFLEWAEYNGDLYGTSEEEVARAREAGRDLLLEIEVQGAKQVSRKIPGAITIFLMPPSYDELVRRLRGRGTESEASIARRLRSAAGEVRHYREFRYLVVNETLEQAAGEIRAVLSGARHESGGGGPAALLETEARVPLAERIVAGFPAPDEEPRAAGSAPRDHDAGSGRAGSAGGGGGPAGSAAGGMGPGAGGGAGEAGAA
jgi:guanylate kinase